MLFFVILTSRVFRLVVHMFDMQNLKLQSNTAKPCDKPYLLSITHIILVDMSGFANFWAAQLIKMPRNERFNFSKNT